MTSLDFDLAKYPPHLQALCRNPLPDLRHGLMELSKALDYRAKFSTTDADLGDLLEIASFVGCTDELPKDCFFAPYNAWYAISQLNASSAVAGALEQLNSLNWTIVDVNHNLIHIVLVGIGRSNMAAILAALADDRRHDILRAILCRIATEIAESDSEHRESVIRVMVDALSEKKIGFRFLYNAFCTYLAKLHASDALPLVDEIYANGLAIPHCDKCREAMGEKLGGEIAATNIPTADVEKADEIIEAFYDAEEKFPREEMLEARRHRDLIVPSLIKELRQATAYARYDAPFVWYPSLFAVHLFAEFQTKEAIPYVLESLSLTDDQAWELYEDGLYESMPGIMYRLIGDDFKFYDDKIRNAETPYVLRRCLINSLYYLVKNGVLTKESLVSAARDYVRSAIDEADPEWVVDVLDLLLDCGDLSDLPLVTEAFEKNLVDKDFTNLQEATEDLSEKNFDEAVARHTKSDFTDAIAELSCWDCFQAKKTPPPPRIPVSTLPGKPQPRKPLLEVLSTGVFPPKLPKAGRNDPCPCGSGKKYKKCCLKQG